MAYFKTIPLLVADDFNNTSKEIIHLFQDSVNSTLAILTKARTCVPIAIIGSVMLNTVTVIFTKNYKFIMSDIDGIYISNYRLPILDKISQNNIIQFYKINYLKKLPYNKFNFKQISPSKIYIEDIVFFQNAMYIHKLIKDCKLNWLEYSYQLNGVYEKNIYPNNQVLTKQLLLTWGLAKFLAYYQQTLSSSIYGRYNLAKGLREIDELFYFNQERKCLIYTGEQINRYIINKYNIISDFLHGIEKSGDNNNKLSEILEQIVADNEFIHVSIPLRVRIKYLRLLYDYVFQYFPNSRLIYFIKNNLYKINSSDSF